MVGKQSREALEVIAASFRALSEPTRLAIVQELKAGPRTVGELVERLGLSQANVSKHLSVLREAGYLSREKQGTSALYAISDPVLMQICALVCERLNARSAQVEIYSI